MTCDVGSAGEVQHRFGDVFVGRPQGFALCYALVRLAIVALYARTWAHARDGQALALRNTIGFGIGALLWLASIAVPHPWVFLMWGAAVLIDFAVPLNRRARADSMRNPPTSYTWPNAMAS